MAIPKGASQQHSSCDSLEPHRITDALPRHEFEVLAIVRGNVAAILNNQQTSREARPEIGTADIEAVRFRCAIDACRFVGNDMEMTDEFVVATSFVQCIIVRALVGCDEIAATILTLENRQALNVVRQVAVLVGAINEYPIFPTVGLRRILPDRYVFFANIQVTRLIISDAALRLRPNAELAQQCRTDLPVTGIGQLPLFDNAVGIVDEYVGIAADRAAVHAHPIGIDHTGRNYPVSRLD